MSTRRDRFVGCLTGVVVGECLGARLDGLDAGPISHRFPTEESFAELEPASYGPASEMTLAVATSLIESKGLDLDAMTEEMGRVVSDGSAYGATTTRALSEQQFAGADEPVSSPLRERGRESYGNGAAARTAPIGLVYCDDAEELREVAESAAGITHKHVLGMEGAVVQATAVALALLGGGRRVSGERFLAALHAETRAREFRSRLEGAADLLTRKTVSREKLVARLGNNKTALGSVVTAIYCFARHTDSFEKAVVLAASLGGNSATLASMTGAVAGAYLGATAIPGRWREALADGEITAAKLTELGLALAECEPGSAA